MKKLIISAAVALTLMSCEKVVKETTVVTPANVTNIDQMVVPANFDYNTTVSTQISVKLLTNDDKPLIGVRVDIMDGASDMNSKTYLTGSTDANGILNATIELPTSVSQVIINPNYIGLPNGVILDVNSPIVNLTLGGSAPQKISTVSGRISPIKVTSLGKATDYSFRLGTWNSSGVPNYLVTPRDVVSSAFLADVNATLPEQRPVPVYNPGYLSSAVERNLKITSLSDVWVTFVHEGAGYQNSLFFYAYNKNTPPATPNDIDSLRAVFPNVSYSGSGGGLTTGDKVLIGRFGADTVIGFAIVSNGFKGSTIATSPIYFSDKNLNTIESDATKREHSVLFYDNVTNRFMFGFEDLPRSTGGSDNDFNDAVFFAKSNPVTAISQINVLPIKPSVDADNDGVTDAQDEYPNDPTKAFNNYYPSVNGAASVAFEDQWPSKGDYDLNDLVIDYRYKIITNAANKVVRVEGKFKPRAAGGVYKNGFGIEFPTLRGNAVNMTGATLEAGQANAVAILFTNARVRFNNAFNTVSTEPIQNVDTISISFDLTSPIALNTFTLGSYNPFIYVDEAGKGRGFEVHLAGKAPTTLANRAVFGTSSDNTNPPAVYYKTKNNLPYAINIAESFKYPKERVQIINAYNLFVNWAQSGGTTSTDWYKNTSGYRNNANIY
ncbi:MAG: LruC domain-containing protein [Candidatus Methylacidiphilales bacterium]